ncbi:type II methionyl aminopeptidase [Infirmifilum lucidum]|uniref:Methionine aminopeptidase n=1 Tax=Infirmifilum lucidum TaxID=2776706 RepID=A0A7L9FL17_9CREN|nr:type II methionyl aminopeptidase [Infirmifilum lucidum]QOJ79644.1 type II methionyl aminopeptidase [Infirmifilum lucidum]
MEEKYSSAGQIASMALRLAMDIVDEGVPLIEIAERLEGFIVSRGGRPAFPVNIAINDVAAHYSPGIEDPSVIPKGALVKVDLGVHVDGYIVDAAVTIALDSRFKNLVRASLEALEDAITAAKAGANMNEVGATILKRISSYGLRPIRNLTGHKIERFELHAGKSVPNAPGAEYLASRMLDGEVFAIEPFATDGAGYAIERGRSNIFRVVSTKKIPREDDLNRALEALWREFKGLPFSERWVVDKTLSREQLEQLVKMKRVYHYPMLVEQGHGFVSQFEDTVIVTKDRALPLANTTKLSEGFYALDE